MRSDADPPVELRCALNWRPGWFILLALSCLPAAARATEKPLWEFGFGAGALIFNDYRGADTTHAYPVPFPYFVYRGDFLKADRDGMRGVFFERSRVEINVSVYATTPVRNDRARSGMPDLRPTLELGPALQAHLWSSGDERARLDLRAPLRGAVTVEASPQFIGWFFSPQLNLDMAGVNGLEGWKLGLLAGPLFADRRYHDYFYGVAPPYSTAQRPTYGARGGYSGAQALASVSRRFPNYWFGAYVRYDALEGAVFTDSPLVRRRGYWSTGFGVAWMIGESRQTVDAAD